jgi:hypothetical protein
VKLVVHVEVEVADKERALRALSALDLGLEQYGFADHSVTPTELDGAQVDEDLDPWGS